MELLQKNLCPEHKQPITFVCISSSCTSPFPICKNCVPAHSEHAHRMLKFEDLHETILTTLKDQNSKDVETLKDNDLIISRLNQFSKAFSDKERELLNGLMKKLEGEKNDVLRKTKNQKEKLNSEIIQYFDTMSEKGLIGHRLMFSSQKGIKDFYFSYKKYCEISNISIHIKPEILENFEEEEEDLNFQISKSMSGTLTQNIMNYIKLKVSKRDAMRVSSAAAVTGSTIKPSHVGLPPLSPQKKRKIGGKTELNLDF